MCAKYFKTFIEISRIQSELNRSFKNLIKAQREQANRLTGELIPDIDIVETDKYLTIRIDLPGVNVDDIKLTLSGNNLLIAGKKHMMEIPQKNVKFHCLERNYGNFTRIVQIDTPVETNNIRAQLENGVLSVIFNKIIEKNLKEIPIEIKKGNVKK